MQTLPISNINVDKYEDGSYTPSTIQKCVLFSWQGRHWAISFIESKPGKVVVITLYYLQTCRSQAEIKILILYFHWRVEQFMFIKRASDAQLQHRCYFIADFARKVSILGRGVAGFEERSHLLHPSSSSVISSNSTSTLCQLWVSTSGSSSSSRELREGIGGSGDIFSF